MIDYPDVLELIDVDISEMMNQYSKYETIKKFKLLSRPFSIEKGEMTPKMSIVRKQVEKNFSDVIDNIYN